MKNKSQAKYYFPWKHAHMELKIVHVGEGKGYIHDQHIIGHFHGYSSLTFHFLKEEF